MDSFYNRLVVCVLGEHDVEYMDVFGLHDAPVSDKTAERFCIACLNGTVRQNVDEIVFFVVNMFYRFL